MFPARVFAAISVTAAVGCGGYVEPTAVADVEVSGSVSGIDAKSLTGVLLSFQPASTGAAPTAFEIKPDGTFAGKAKPGTYAFYLAPAKEGDTKAEAAIGKLGAFGRADANRTVAVPSGGGKIEVKF